MVTASAVRSTLRPAMDNATRDALSRHRERLAGLDPYRWTAVEEWREAVRPFLVHVLHRHVERFDELTKRPAFVVGPRIQTSRGNNFAQAAATDELVNRARAAEAKAKLLSFLDSLLALPPAPPAHGQGVVINNYAETQMGDKYTTNISHSNVGAAAIGAGAVATGSVAAAAPPTQEQHRKAVAEAQGALVRDQDALDALDTRMFEALNQFLRLARDIQVEQKSLADVQAKMKETLDEVWAEQAAKGMKPQLLPKTLEVVGAIASNPVMIEVTKKLIGG
ncbi:hypothetical protein [Sorangium sp. So ce131]|uniref:hypothetical protein n=1 Tax=Sorangium sp. So ce131 TaxID=3133282 RepID=UPI003F616091